MTDRPRLFGRLALFGPTAVVVGAAVAILSVSPESWVRGTGLFIALFSTWVHAWYVAEDARPAFRVLAGTLGAAAAAVLAWLLLGVAWPATITSDGLLPGWTVALYVLVPLVALPVASVSLKRRAPDVPVARMIVSWLGALVAIGGSFPLIGLAATGSGAEDMAGLIVLWIPVVALCVWSGSALSAVLATRMSRSPAVSRDLEEASSS